MDKRLNIDEIIDLVRQKVTLNGRLPFTLTNDNIERIIKEDGLRYFYRNYKYGNQITYYYVDLQSYFRNTKTGARFITLPDEIIAIKWIYLVNYQDMHNLGYLLPRNGIGMGQTTQPFVATINVSEFAQSVGALQTFQDALAMFSKNTVKFSFDPNSKRFEVLTSLNRNLILEVRAEIPADALFGDPLFIDYVTGKTMMEYSTHLSYTDMQLAGNTKISTDRIYEQGEKLVENAIEKMNKMTKSAFFFNRTR